MKKIILNLYIFFAALSQAQNLAQSENYVYSRTYMEPVTSEQPNAAQLQNVQYLDGLGRPVQNIAVKASISGKDIVVPITYDTSGRQIKSFLPLPSDSQNGAYLTNANENTVNAYYGISNAYQQTTYEKSPWGRPEKQAMPGDEWQIGGAHTQKVEYALNGEGKVKRFQAKTLWNASTGINDVSLVTASDDAYTSGGYYKTGTLYETIVKDEDGKQAHSFKNSNGQNILERRINKKPDGTEENLDTYYVYNESGSLVFVIPPKAANSAMSQTILDNLCYQYKYDKHGRIAEKKLPGKGWEYAVYDKAGRVLMTQDSNLKSEKRWLVAKYDKFSRVVYTGITNNTTSRSDLQQYINNSTESTINNEQRTASPFTVNGMSVYYTNTVSPGVIDVLLSVNYYDTYPTYSFNPPFPASIQGQSVLTDTHSDMLSTRTMPTLSLVKNIENESWTKNYIYYDKKGRAVGSYESNHLGGFTRTESLLDFSGNIKESYAFHSKNSTSVQVTVKDRYIYSPQNFLLKHYQKINSNPEELLSEYTYNDIGQIINKKTGAGLQSIDYSYNIRGWLAGINASDIDNMGNKLFAYKIKYNAVEGAETPNNSLTNLKVKPRYNGSIAEVDWKTASGANEPLRRYGYVYDGAERLMAGFYQISTNPYSREYSEVMDYDQNGNITSLHRTGSAVNGTAEVIDNLSYNYRNGGNQLEYVKESGKGNALSGYPLASGQGATMKYDTNGNLTLHMDKRHDKITYNFLNLPSAIFSSSPSETLKYVYASDGTKMKMTKDTDVTDYLGAFQYTVNTSSGAQPSFVLSNEEGYYDFVNNRYVYQYRDHLGNIRVSYAKGNGSAAVILEENNYYPFGLKHAGYNTGNTTNNKFKYLYNGKELQSTGNLDYGWRQYMPDLGKWNGMDQLSEIYYSASPYAYVMNNPISNIDPDGRIIRDGGDRWEFEGDDINWAMSYFGSGGSVKALDNALSAWLQGGGTFENENENFWRDFEGVNVALPEIAFTGRSKLVWGLQLRNHVNTYVSTLNAQSDLEWKKLTCGHCFDGPVKMIGGLYDPVGFFDVLGQVLSNMKPESREQALAIGAVALLATKGKAADDIIKAESKIWKVGAYNELKGVEIGLDAHHVGQSALMKKLVPGYSHNTAPSILVPVEGHRFLGPNGIVSRSTKGFENARQVLARDIFELRRVYGDQNIPNSALKELIQLNKNKFPSAFEKIKDIP